MRGGNRDTFPFFSTFDVLSSLTFLPLFRILPHSDMNHTDSIPLIESPNVLPPASREAPAVLSARIQERLVEELLEKALHRLGDLLDAEDDSLVQKTATYLVDLAKEVAGLKRGEGKAGSSGVNIAIFNPRYLTDLAKGAREVLEGDIIEVEVEGEKVD